MAKKFLPPAFEMAEKNSFTVLELVKTTI